MSRWLPLLSLAVFALVVPGSREELVSLAPAQEAGSAAAVRTLAQKQAVELAALRVRYAHAIAALAEAELQAGLEERRQSPGRVTWAQLQRMQAVAHASRLTVQVAELAQNPLEVGKEALRLALAQRVSARFQDTPLADFVAALREKHQINVVLDKKALDDAGVGVDSPISIDVQNAALQTILTLALKELDLTFVFEDDILVITTKDDAGNRLDTVIYDIYDLLVWNAMDNGGYPDDVDYQTFIELITATVSPTTWDTVGGPGSIAPVMGTLILSQTQEVHSQIADLLYRLRKTRLSRSDRLGLMKVLEAGQ